MAISPEYDSLCIVEACDQSKSNKSRGDGCGAPPEYDRIPLEGQCGFEIPNEKPDGCSINHIVIKILTIYRGWEALTHHVTLPVHTSDVQEAGQMDVITQIQGIIVQWDSDKNEANLRKHDISFDMALNVFFDENRIEYFDAKHSEEEDRYITIGMVEDVLFVVYTERKGKIRLISARYATASERRRYYGDYNEIRHK